MHSLKNIHELVLPDLIVSQTVAFCVSSVTWHLLKVDWLKSTFWFCQSDIISLLWWLQVMLLMKLKSIFCLPLV